MIKHFSARQTNIYLKTKQILSLLYAHSMLESSLHFRNWKTMDLDGCCISQLWRVGVAALFISWSLPHFTLLLLVCSFCVWFSYAPVTCTDKKQEFIHWV